MAIDLFYPHPEYDFKATEHWLEKKARKGWHMIPGGNLNGLAAFERGEPKGLRYRLVPTGKTGLIRADDNPPNAEAIELYSRMGWEYVCNRGSFHIFRTENPYAPEPDTDPQVLALSLKPTVKRAVLETLSLLTYVIMHLVLNTPFYIAYRANDPKWLLIYLPLLAAVLSRLFSCLRLIRYQHICRRGGFPEVRRRLYLPDNILLASCLMLAILPIILSDNALATPPGERYDNYVLYENHEWPFTIPGAEVTQTDAASYTTFATRENWYWDGYIVMADGSRSDIYIDYADFRSELLATCYAWEMNRHNRTYQIIRRGTEVYEIHSRVTIEDPEAVFFGKE